MTIYIFGNPIEPSDSLPIQIISQLKKEFPEITFIHADPTENWWQGENELVIMDTVVGIEKVTVFNSLDEFEKQTQITPHDYDIYMDLQLMLKIGNVSKVKIIGIPSESSRKTILRGIKKSLE